VLDFWLDSNNFWRIQPVLTSCTSSLSCRPKLCASQMPMHPRAVGPADCTATFSGLSFALQCCYWLIYKIEYLSHTHTPTGDARCTLVQGALPLAVGSGDIQLGKHPHNACRGTASNVGGLGWLLCRFVCLHIMLAHRNLAMLPTITGLLWPQTATSRNTTEAHAISLRA
jgi:hypothetical protein